jgi:hypothetical protein
MELVVEVTYQVKMRFIAHSKQELDAWLARREDLLNRTARAHAPCKSGVIIVSHSVERVDGGSTLPRDA